jgi:hypothetical protein
LVKGGPSNETAHDRNRPIREKRGIVESPESRNGKPIEANDYEVKESRAYMLRGEVKEKRKKRKYRREKKHES